MRIYLDDVAGAAFRVFLHATPGAVLGAITLVLSGSWTAASVLTGFFLAFMWLVTRPHRTSEEAKAWRELRRLTSAYRDGEHLVATLDDDMIVFTCRRKRGRSLRRTLMSDVELPQIDAERGVLPYDDFLLTSMWRIARLSGASAIMLDDDDCIDCVDDPQARAITEEQARAGANALVDSGYYKLSNDELRELVAQVRAARPS